MRSARLRNALLSSVGLVALAAYILACRPSFSPDGSKLLVPVVFDKTISVAVHDLKTGEARWLCEGLPFGSDFGVAAAWLPDGKRAVVIWLAEGEKKEDELRVMVLPAAGGKPSGVWKLAADEEAALALVIPPPVLGHHLFLGGKRLQRLDLGSGEVKTVPTEGQIHPVGHGTALHYIRAKDTESGKVYEVGTLDGASLDRKPILGLRAKEHGEISPFFAISKDGSRLALVSADEEPGKILIYRGQKLEKTIPLGKKGQKRSLGNVEWSPDGQTFYLAFAASKRLGVLEVSAGTAALREIPFFESREDADEAVLFFQIALSPDGKMLAGSSGCFDPKKLAPGERALWLLDLAGKERKVRKVALPGK
ncbi:MAG: WD40 repeat domain-containing protein [Planctomycetota bacterium]|jgi:WD40 repeat protein